MRTLPLTRYFLAYAITTYVAIVAFGTSVSALLFNEPWKRSAFAGAVFVTMAAAIGATINERARRLRSTAAGG